MEQKVPFSPLAQSFMSEKEETPVMEENEVDVLEKNTPIETKDSNVDISSNLTVEYGNVSILSIKSYYTNQGRND